MLDVLETVAIGGTIAALLVGVLSSVPIRSSSRIIVAALMGGWVGFVSSIVAGGGLSLRTLLGIFLTPIVAVVVLRLAVPAFRRALAQLSPVTIIQLNAFRVIGVFFLILAFAGRMGGLFPYSAGIGDIIAGIFALSAARIAARESLSDWRVVAWNVWGTLDLVVAVTLGVMSRAAANATLPWALIPTVLVPMLLIGHAIVFAHMRFAAAPQQGYASSAT